MSACWHLGRNYGVLASVKRCSQFRLLWYRPMNVLIHDTSQQFSLWSEDLHGIFGIHLDALLSISALSPTYIPSIPCCSELETWSSGTARRTYHPTSVFFIIFWSVFSEDVEGVAVKDMPAKIPNKKTHIRQQAATGRLKGLADIKGSSAS